jgi:hypothetical protein
MSVFWQISQVCTVTHIRYTYYYSEFISGFAICICFITQACRNHRLSEPYIQRLDIVCLLVHHIEH